ncbi:hypothetical protein SLAV_13740 [Streptomyces lavendulae subsp. lavendulae]|uniref:Uncharacterized protein n=1 Tax=Streptomyces lavendulae subsp. lavendulae TaxID=58340 RepID=A0A2K8PCZ1_STRLA|nr:hypothetical protein [Streptomyces lavendulae]ATZ24604.1 hypothetical protein SLAV_13740 [Streptomyces lavendulae subsp. lavendulae]QUQ54434.1 hypothetical protein SLLC_11810 [Streptomyces lavendulae subsp. lavendulae]
MTTVDPYAVTDGPAADDTGTARPGAPSPGPRAPSAGAAGPAGAQSARRRGGGDPVKALLHRHRELCERAVDALEVAAGLEAHGITDRTAARFRHRDVFSLAEELYARTPRGETPTPPPARTPAGPRAVRRFGCALLPGALAFAAAAAGTPWTGPLTVLLTAGALVWPGRWAAGRFPYAAHLLAAAVVGWAVHRHGAALGAALALAVAPGHLAAAYYAARARRRLAGSRALKDFAAGARPLLAGVLLPFGAAAAGAAALAGADPAEAVPLAVLLFLVRLLLRHGAHRAPLAAALALALVPAPAAVAAAAAGLLVHAVLALSRASAHARP